MYTRILSYDLNNGKPEDYEDLYDYLDSVNAEKITESSYLIKTKLDYTTFKNKILSITKYGDVVKAIVLVDDNFEIRTIR